MDGGLQEVKQRTKPEIVILSYFISVLGAQTTLELLGRRTSHLGVINWLRLIGAAFSMGFVGIWTMHFVGQKALVLGDGRPEEQLRYDIWFTLLSLVVPILVLTLAFYFIGAQPQVDILRLLGGGTTAGLTVAFMHYCGQFAIQFYKARYDVGLTISAVLIALVAANAALYIFFALRAVWRNQWYKRLGASMVMATAVTGMHFTAYAGTHYYAVPGEIQTVPATSEKLIIGLNVAGSLLACGTLVVFMLFTRKAELRTKRHAQNVVLGSAIYNSQGQILVTNSGTIPMKKITTEYRQKNLQDEFTVNHPVFQWLYRLTHDWSSIEEWLPYIDSHLQVADKIASRKVPYSLQFREMFVSNARSLAESLNLNFDDIGCLFDNILNTGQTTTLKALSRKKHITTPGWHEVLGKGQMLFLVKKLNDRTEEERFLRLGHQFVDSSLISPSMASSLNVSPDIMRTYFDEMSTYNNHNSVPSLEPDAVYAGLFICQPQMSGMKVLVSANNRHQIPVARLSGYVSLTLVEREHVRRKGGTSMVNVYAQIGKTFFGEPNGNDIRSMLSINAIRSMSSNTDLASVPSNTDLPSTQNNTDVTSVRRNSVSTTSSTFSEFDNFRYNFAQAMLQLMHLIEDKQIYNDAVLYPEVFKVPIPGVVGRYAELIVFKVLLNSNQKFDVPDGSFKFIPYNMFHSYQDILYYRTPMELQQWRNKVRKDFGFIAEMMDSEDDTNDESEGTSKRNAIEMVMVEQTVETVVVTDSLDEKIDPIVGVEKENIGELTYDCNITVSKNNFERWFEVVARSFGNDFTNADNLQ
ncbi:10462_t:CDS:2 [Paraglomus occultum]|uniref:10462_t:CDS:1 n=1 Tax=Paraglomus occultum TaxID=144539 RepID=A0A9N8WE52_9GLOM|nr:10462_t:CDS:2 [Paraglomus occultum]